MNAYLRISNNCISFINRRLRPDRVHERRSENVKKKTITTWTATQLNLIKNHRPNARFLSPARVTKLLYDNFTVLSIYIHQNAPSLFAFSRKVFISQRSLLLELEIVTVHVHTTMLWELIRSLLFALRSFPFFYWIKSIRNGFLCASRFSQIFSSGSLEAAASKQKVVTSHWHWLLYR